MADLRDLAQGSGDVIVIAEAGVNHNGSEDTAHRLIDVAVEAGADFVKFQTFDPSRLVAPRTAATPYQRARGARSQTELLEALALPRDAWARLRDHAVDAGIGFLSTPFDTESARLLVDLDVAALKLSSGELTNVPFIADVASLGVPLLLSTGMGSEDEVVAAVAAAAAAPSVSVFHCVSAYPAPLEECNLRAIPALAARTGVAVGWSDHTIGVESAVIAAALGARLFEKHFTLDKGMPGPDHVASLEPGELRDYVQRLAEVPVVLGDGVKRRMPSEEENALLVRRSWHAAADLAPGHVIGVGDLIALRPESGITPVHDLVGRTVAAPLAVGEPVTDDAIVPERA